MLYIIDSDFGYVQHPNASIIFEVGSKATTKHGAELLKVIHVINASEVVELIDIGAQPVTSDIIKALDFINNSTTGTILIAWSMPFNEKIDQAITKLAKTFKIIVAGGNAQQDIQDLTPCSNRKVITVGSLNKSNDIASHNSKGHLDVYAPGTNINVDGKKVSGSSIAAAIFAGYYTRSNDCYTAQNAVAEEFDKLIHQKF